MLHDLQDEIKELLQGDPYFADITSIVTMREGYVPAEVEKAEAVLKANTRGKVGLAIIIAVASMKTRKPNVPGPQLDEIIFGVRVLENVEVNKSGQGIGKPAEEVAEYLIATLHGRLLDQDRSTLLHRETMQGDDPMYHGLDAFFSCEGRLLYQPGQVATPVVN